MVENKTSESQLKAVRKWEKENTYKTTITFYKHKFPKDKYERAKKEIKNMGLSLNEFFELKLKEILNKEREN